MDADNDGMRIWWPAMLLGSAAVFGAFAYGFYSWRVAHFPHSIATITKLWEEQVEISSSGRRRTLGYLLSEPKYKTVTMGEIEFTRFHKGIAYNCIVSRRLGVPSDAFVVGGKLDRSGNRDLSACGSHSPLAVNSAAHKFRM